MTEISANEFKHLTHPFYKEVEDYVLEVSREQILKGAAKYTEPFDPDSWTGEELANHAMQENRDQAVYITGMRTKMRQQERRIKELEIEVASLSLACLTTLDKGQLENLLKELGERLGSKNPVTRPV